VYVVNFTRFRVRGEPATAVIQARRACAGELVGDAHYGAGMLVELENGEWLDISIWRWQTPHERMPADSPLVEFVDRIAGPGTEIFGQESGRVVYGQPGNCCRSRSFRLDFGCVLDPLRREGEPHCPTRGGLT
jgi:hypothetical protein